MEFEKNFEKFSFGFGTAKAAGKGDMSQAEPVKRSLSSKADRKLLLKNAAKGAAAAGVFLIRHKMKKAKKKK